MAKASTKCKQMVAYYECLQDLINLCEERINWYKTEDEDCNDEYSKSRFEAWNKILGQLEKFIKE